VSVVDIRDDSRNIPKRVELVNSGYQTRLSGRLLLGTAGILAFPFLLAFAQRFIKWGRGFRMRRGSLWTGGTPYRPEVMQVTGSAFTSQIWMASAVQNDGLPYPGKEAETSAQQVFPTAEQITDQRAVPEAIRGFYDSAVRRLLTLAQRFGDWAEPGDIRRYLVYIFIVFLFVLAILSRLIGPGGVK
jgi:hypothetical protein